jgi:hypothetical protein
LGGPIGFGGGPGGNGGGGHGSGHTGPAGNGYIARLLVAASVVEEAAPAPSSAAANADMAQSARRAHDQRTLSTPPF